MLGNVWSGSGQQIRENAVNLRSSKLDTFANYYNDMMDQQKQAQKLYDLIGLQNPQVDRYESNYNRYRK